MASIHDDRQSFSSGKDETDIAQRGLSSSTSEPSQAVPDSTQETDSAEGAQSNGYPGGPPLRSGSRSQC